MGDGFKILYPVINSTPGTLTFSLMTGTTGNQDLTISNIGGGNLNWTVTKNSADSIFNLSQSTGINTGIVTVTANASALAVGVYSNTLTIHGAGIDQVAQVLPDLTVTPVAYNLAVTLKLTTPGKGGGTVTSTVPDSSLSCQRNGGMTDVTCSHNFPHGTITLSQTPDSNTVWATWGTPACGSNPTCQIALNNSPGAAIDATFPYSFMAKVSSNGFVSDSLLSAYNSAAISDIIKTRAVTFDEGSTGSIVILNSDKTIDLVGGVDAYYLPTNGYPTIRNVLKIGSGRINIKGGIKIRYT